MPKFHILGVEKENSVLLESLPTREEADARCEQLRAGGIEYESLKVEEHGANAPAPEEPEGEPEPEPAPAPSPALKVKPKKTDLSTARAIAALLLNPTLSAAAKAAGVSQRTLHRWLDDPEFKESVAIAGRGMVDAAKTYLLSLVGDALKTLQEGLSSESEKVRLASATTILRFALAKDAPQCGAAATGD